MQKVAYAAKYKYMHIAMVIEKLQMHAEHGRKLAGREILCLGTYVLRLQQHTHHRHMYVGRHYICIHQLYVSSTHSPFYFIQMSPKTSIIITIKRLSSSTCNEFWYIMEAKSF